MLSRQFVESPEVDIVFVGTLHLPPMNRAIELEYLWWMKQALGFPLLRSPQQPIHKSRALWFLWDNHEAYDSTKLDLARLATSLLESLARLRTSSKARKRPLVFVCLGFEAIVLKTVCHANVSPVRKGSPVAEVIVHGAPRQDETRASSSSWHPTQKRVGRRHKPDLASASPRASNGSSEDADRHRQQDYRRVSDACGRPQEPVTIEPKYGRRKERRRNVPDDAELSRSMNLNREAAEGSANSPQAPARHYTIGWINALPIESVAARLMLDEIYTELPFDGHDPTVYNLGSIGVHSVVMASLPAGQYGTSPATVVATRMLDKFRTIKIGFMVGVGGGVPNNEDDVRLGDVVVSVPHLAHGGVVQYDFGKEESGGRFRRSGHLNTPPKLLLNVVRRIQLEHEMGNRAYERHLERFAKHNMQRYRRRQTMPDLLFPPSYIHITGRGCDNCDTFQQIPRLPRDPDNPTVKIHYGTKASGNKVTKDAIIRDNIVKDLGGRILCFEMEAAGLMNDFPCLVVRGISDYCDSRKQDAWQRIAAASAAAYTRELLMLIPAEDVAKQDVIRG